MIAAAEPAGREAARERELHFGDVLLGEVRLAIGGGRIEGPAVVPRDVGDVLGRLEPAFDLEAAHAGVDELRHERVRGQILRAQQIFDIAQIDVFAVADQVVGQPAGLGTLAAVRAAAAERFAGQALAGIGHAQRAVDEHFELDRRLAAGSCGFRRSKVRGPAPRARCRAPRRRGCTRRW